MRKIIYYILAWLVTGLLYLLPVPVAAQTSVKDTIDGETWTKVGSPYQVTGDLFVVNLTIMPGVQVQVQNDYQFTILGRLTAIGSKRDSIRFSGGRGLLFSVGSSTSSLAYCTIQNTSLYGIRFEESITLFEKCWITGSAANGIEIAGCIMTLSKCVLAENTEHGVLLDSHGAGIFSNCTIRDNDNNGIYADTGKITLNNSVVSYNDQGGIFLPNSADTLIMVNSNVVYNPFGPGIASIGSTMDIKNSIIYFNASGIGYSGGSVQINYNDIQDWSNPDNNINVHPSFADTTNFTLASNSQCIDHGDPGSAFNDVCFPPSRGTTRNDMGIYGGPGACGWYDPLYIVPETLNFGNSTVLDTSYLALTFKNYSDSDLTIDDLIISGTDPSYFGLDYLTPFAISPFDSVQIGIFFLPQQVRFYTAILTVISGSDSQDITLAGSGVIPDINTVPSVLDYQNVDVGDSTTRFIQISNVGLGRLRISNITSSNPAFSLQVGQFPWFISSFQIDTLAVVFKPDTNRIYNDSLMIYTNDPHPNESQFRIMLNGTGKAPVLAISVDTLLFGSVLVDHDSIAAVILNNTGNDTLHIYSKDILGTDSAHFQITSSAGELTLPPAVTDTVQLRFQPPDTGVYAAILTVNSDDPFNNPHIIILQGTGVVPRLLTSADSLNFGQVQVSADSLLNLIITNTGTAALEIKNINILPDSTAFAITAGLQDHTLSPDGSADTIQVSFSPVTAGNVSAVLQMLSNDPDHDSVQIQLTGRGVNFELAVNPDDSLFFGSIAVGNDSTLSVLLENLGSGDLQIRSRLSGNDAAHFALNSSDTSFIIPENVPQHQVQLSFSPFNRGAKKANLEIYSNDTDHPSILIKLEGIALAAELYSAADSICFDTTYVWENDTQVVNIFNHGELDLLVDSIRISGPDSTEFNPVSPGLPLTITAGPDSQVIRFRFNPLSSGDKNNRLYIYSNDPLSPALFILKATARLDATPATISIDTTGLSFSTGSSTTLHLVLKDNESIIQAASLFAKPGGKNIFQEINLTCDHDSLWSVVLPARLITERGLEYYLDAQHGGIVTSYPPGGASAPLIGMVHIPVLTYPYATLGKQYQMISLPVQTGDQKLSDLFRDDLGSYDDIHYRFFDWDTDSSIYTELSTLDSPLPPGKALWLITKESHVLKIENARSTLNTADYTLPVSEGWNMVGVPYAFPVSWDQIDHGGIQGGTLWYYTGNLWRIDSVLVPFRGYAVQATTDTILHIPAQEADTLVVPKRVKPNEWHVQIIAQKGEYSDSYNYAGIRSNAQDGMDICDISEPPVIGSFVSLYFQSDSADAVKSRLAGDFREANHNQYFFNLRLINNFSGQTRIQIIPCNLPDNFDWVLLSTHSKLRYPKELVVSERLQESFQLVIGTRNVIQIICDQYREIPDRFQLAQNFPNPFNPATTITYQLPQAAELSIEIFDILGRRIRTLLSKTTQDAGYYQLTWDGNNDHHQAVASAMYILFLRSEKYQKAVKMILQR